MLWAAKAPTFRITTSPSLQTAAYVAIIVWECATSVILIAAVVAWVRGRARGFASARTLSTIGLLMLVLLFAGGFISVGGEWFAMYRSTTWNGLEPAFRNSVIALIGIVLIHLPSTSWSPEVIEATSPDEQSESST